MNIAIHDYHTRFGTTHKRAGIEEYVAYAMNKNADTISVISSGNLFMELKNELRSRERSLRLVNLVNTIYDAKDAIVMCAGQILRDAQEREAYVNQYGRETGTNFGVVVDVTDFLPAAYFREADIILSSKPDYVSVPIGSGKHFIAIYRKIKALGLDTKLIGFLPKGENGIFPANNFILDNKLFFKDFSPKSRADKLVTPYVLATYQEEILQAQREGHILHELTLSEERKAIRQAKRFPVVSEPSSAVAFFATHKDFLKHYDILDTSKMIVVNTGKGMHEYDVVTVPISPIKKIAGVIGSTATVLSLMYLLLNHPINTIITPNDNAIYAQLTEEFYQIYHAGLRVDGQLPVMSPSNLDRICDERDAFVYGDTEHMMYLSKTEAIEIARVGSIAREKHNDSS